MHPRVLLLVIGLCCLAQAAPYHFIGTGRGALTAVQTGPTAYKIEEQPWVVDDIDPPSDAQLWSLEYNRKIANQTLFIRSKLYPTQVWDATGNTVQPGTKVILYANKSTEVASRNQRWNFTYPLDSLKASGIYSAMDYASFVTVNSLTGTLEMQRKISTPLSPYQSFYPIQQGQNPTTFVTNSLWTEVYVRAKGPLGEFYVWSIWPQTPMNYGLPKGVILEFATDENFQYLIAPSPYVITGSATFRVPMPPRLPEGPRKYTGFTSDPNFPNTLETEGTFTFKNDLVAGSGKATVQGTSYVFTWTVTSGQYRAGDSDFEYEVRYSNGVTAHMTAYVSSDATEFGGYINYNEPDSFRFYLSPV